MILEKAIIYKDMIDYLDSLQASQYLSEETEETKNQSASKVQAKLKTLKEIIESGEEYLHNNPISEEEYICLFSILYAQKKITKDLRFCYNLPEGSVYMSRFYNHIFKVIEGPQTITFRFF